MNVSTLAHQPLHRPGGPGISERFSSDFLVDGESLLQVLTRAEEGHSDYVSCFVRGWDEFNASSRAQLLLRAPPDTASGRVLLYICPECGDLGCGAFTVRVSKTNSGYIWSDFAHENGYEDSHPLTQVGPFHFLQANYEQVMKDAATP